MPLQILVTVAQSVTNVIQTNNTSTSGKNEKQCENIARNNQSPVFDSYHVRNQISPKSLDFCIWRPFLVQNGHYSKPEWSPYGAACLTPSKYPFPLKSVHF